MLPTVGCDKSQGFTTCRVPATNTCGGVLYHEAACWVNTASLSSKEIRVGSLEQKKMNGGNCALMGGKTYAGLPFSTSSDATKMSGTSMPAALRAALA